MPYITREDGERFIIPSYRDVLSAKKPALLKKEVMLLSTNYGEYITLQRKNVEQYEAAFSPEPGYLLGETVWHYFKRPPDLIYCEAIPNTTEAILVIVKEGSVYLDGSFSVDSIPDELIIFRTQQNNFEIYIYGDIPLSATAEEGKFSLESSSVKSFNVLPEPVFNTLPKIKAFQLRLVDSVLKSQGIGVVPLKNILAGFLIIALVILGILYLSTNRKELPVAFAGIVNPYQAYINAMVSPAPSTELKSLAKEIAKLYTIPGWLPLKIEYSSGTLIANVKSRGTKLNVLFEWANINHSQVQIASEGVNIIIPVDVIARTETITISPLQQVIAEVLDRISTIIPGNSLTLTPMVDRGRYFEAQLSIVFSDLSVNMMNILADQFKGLPLVLVKLSLNVNNGTLSGILVLKALGN